jgi:ribosome-binding protein aMBF1 (putative translation factor)
MSQLGSRGIVEQLRAARGLLGWSQSELAARGLSLRTVKRLDSVHEYRMKPVIDCNEQLRLPE